MPKLKSLKLATSLTIIGGIILTPLEAELNQNHSKVEAKEDKVEIDNQIANIIANNLEKNNEGHLIIINEKNLTKELEQTNTKLSISEIKKYVKNYNDTISGKKGEKAKNDLQNFNNQISKQNSQQSTAFRSKCSNAIAATGFVHTAAVTGAAVALGVSGPVGWAVGAGMAAAYTGGSMLC